jgi:hypothetical protein
MTRKQPCKRLKEFGPKAILIRPVHRRNPRENLPAMHALDRMLESRPVVVPQGIRRLWVVESGAIAVLLEFDPSRRAGQLPPAFP